MLYSLPLRIDTGSRNVKKLIVYCWKRRAMIGRCWTSYSFIIPRSGSKCCSWWWICQQPRCSIFIASFEQSAPYSSAICGDPTCTPLSRKAIIRNRGKDPSPMSVLYLNAGPFELFAILVAEEAGAGKAKMPMLLRPIQLLRKSRGIQMPNDFTTPPRATLYVVKEQEHH